MLLVMLLAGARERARARSSMNPSRMQGDRCCPSGTGCFDGSSCEDSICEMFDYSPTDDCGAVVRMPACFTGKFHSRT